MCMYNNTHIRMWQQLKKKGPWKELSENINILWLWWRFRFFAFLILFECFYLGQKLILWLNEAMKSFPFWKTNNEWESKAKIWPKVWVRAKLNTNTHCIITEPEQLWCSETEKVRLAACIKHHGPWQHSGSFVFVSLCCCIHVSSDMCWLLANNSY